jgi:hypothetical protein
MRVGRLHVYTLCTNNKTSDGSVIPFVVEYNPTLPNIGNIIKMYWD